MNNFLWIAIAFWFATLATIYLSGKDNGCATTVEKSYVERVG